MRFSTEAEAISYIFRSIRKLHDQERGLDETIRDTGPTKQLLMAYNLLSTPREYAVVTGSKGKGSTTAITAKLLQHLGHKVGMISSPHLVNWRERIRVNGQAIPEVDLCRILTEISLEIDSIEATLGGRRYFSPQGIFLAIALRWFDEQGVRAAVLEVGRGGRYDDIAVVPNKLSVFTPIMLEHRDHLGPTLDRIAWHKAGIIKPYSYAYSVPQSPEVMRILQAEADAQQAEFSWVAEQDMAVYQGTDEDGMRLNMGRYGEVTLSLTGRYQIHNATLAVIAAGNMHGRLRGISHGSAEYIAAIRSGLSDVVWPGRCQKLQDKPLTYVDGAINAESAQLFVDSVRDQLQSPVVTIIGVPEDKDYEGVYAAMGGVSQEIILTQTERNPALRFPPAHEAISTAQRHNANVAYAKTLAEAVTRAQDHAGEHGTILIVGTQSIVAESLIHWGKQYEQI